MTFIVTGEKPAPDLARIKNDLGCAGDCWSAGDIGSPVEKRLR
jgi:hypothetical protein